jgi:hypothetical protein
MHYCGKYRWIFLLICIFYVREITSLIPLEKAFEGKLWATHFLLAPSSYGVMGAPIHLLRESRRVRLVRVADLWAKTLFSTRVVPIAGGGSPFTIFGPPYIIPSMVPEWSSLRHSDGISCSVPGIDSPIWHFHSFLCAGATVPFLAFFFLTT